ncbi:MAG: DNA cytosine methyltransferase [Anaerobiospirillum sp.]|nr:DNA cytosine methyltransferase [Anaerobiospirillum sp.]
MLDLGGGKYRYFTVREAARLQTFPDNYRFVGSWSDCMKQIGNAVPVQLAQCVITALLSTLSAVRSNA